MKFGIRATYKDGTVKYVSSTRHRPSFSSDISNIALFVQESSAVTAVKTIRKDGQEPEGMVLDVVGVEPAILKTVEVPYPKKVDGFVLRSLGFPNEQSFYTGTKKPGQYTQFNSFGNQERATVFATEESAKARARQLVIEAEVNLTTAENESYDRYYTWTPEYKASYRARNVESAKQYLSNVQNMKVEKA